MAACGACGAENPEGSRFCGACGAPLEARCPSCGEPYERDAATRFCRHCGGALEAATATPSGGAPSDAAAPASREGPVSERRVCSVLFADLVGFTALSETKDPEEVREILSRYFDIARRLVRRYGGVVEKFIGDAVMAVWGTPIAREGDAERAVRAAMELVEAVQVLGDEVLGTAFVSEASSKGHTRDAPLLSARAGVVTGEVAVTIGAVGEGMVAGDAVNTAARVQASARPGSVLVDDATRRHVEQAISFDDVGSYELKGKEAPERLFRAVRVLAGMGGTQRPDALEAPFTGRDAELRTLKDLFHTAAERGTARLVVVTGPAGVGKSRLGWEFEKYVDGIADTVLWHRGRCLSYGEGVAFWALAEIVRQRFGIAEEDLTDVAAAKLAEGLVRFVPDAAERDYVGLRLSRLLGTPYPSETKAVLGRDELFAGWRLFFERLAAVAPVAMLIEDGQYADEGLLAFLEHLVDWSRDLPIFVLLFARPGLDAIDTGFGMGRNRSTLSFDPLDRASMKGLVGALVPGMPPGAVAKIVERSQGIPLFAVETVRSLIDPGVVVRDGDAYRLVGEIGDFTVPESLHALLAARLDALPPDLRSLVADAAVLGTTFPVEALVAVSGRDEAEVRSEVGELVRRDVLSVMADPLSPERGSLKFEQEMLQQVAYDTLSKRDRKTRHLAVAAHLRSTFANDGEEIADAVARHFLDAIAADPGAPDADALTAEALRFLVRAAERAERSGALGRAAESFARAAAIAPPADAPVLEERAAETSANHGDSDGALTYATAAAEGWRALGDRRNAARGRALQGRALHLRGRLAAARTDLLEALVVLREDPDGDTVRALEYLATVEVSSGNVESAQELATEAITLSQALGLGDAQMASSFIIMGMSVGRSGRHAEAAALLEFGVRLAERAGDMGQLARAQLNLADKLLSSGDTERAVEVSRSAAVHARRTGMRRFLGVSIVNEAMALIELGRWDEASGVLARALASEHVDTRFVPSMNQHLAALRGDPGGADGAAEWIEAARVTEDEQVLADLGLIEALWAARVGDAARALDLATAVLGRREALGIGADAERLAWPLAARSARRLGDREALDGLIGMLGAYAPGHLPPLLRRELVLYRALATIDAGEVGPEALAALDGAVAGVRELGNPYELGHALCDRAEVLVGVGERAEAASALVEAGAIARALPCAPLLERVTALDASVERAEVPSAKPAGG